MFINQCPGGRIDPRGYQFQPQTNYYPRRYNQEVANYEEPHYGSHREQLREEDEESFDSDSDEFEEEQPNQDGVWRAYKKKGGGMRVVSMGGGKRKKKG